MLLENQNIKEAVLKFPWHWYIEKSVVFFSCSLSRKEHNTILLMYQ